MAKFESNFILVTQTVERKRKKKQTRKLVKKRRLKQNFVSLPALYIIFIRTFLCLVFWLRLLYFFFFFLHISCARRRRGGNPFQFGASLDLRRDLNIQFLKFLGTCCCCWCWCHKPATPPPNPPPKLPRQLLLTVQFVIELGFFFALNF